MDEAQTPHSPRGLFETLDAIEAETIKEGNITLGQLVTLLGVASHHFIILFLTLPFLQPIPLPGISTVVALVIAALAFSLLRGQKPWVPKRLRDRGLNEATLLRMCRVGRSVFNRLRRLIKPRAAWMCASPAARATKATTIIVAALLLSLPLPIPASNFFPALAIFALTLGAIEEDGALMAIGYLAFVVAIGYFVFIGLLPYLGYRAVS